MTAEQEQEGQDRRCHLKNSCPPPEEKTEAKPPESPTAEPEAAKKPARAKEPKAEKPKKTSALDAAAKVMAEAGKPMNTKEMIDAMTAKGLWTSPNGLTPHATLYSAILREMKAKGGQARFKRADRGEFALA